MRNRVNLRVVCGMREAVERGDRAFGARRVAVFAVVENGFERMREARIKQTGMPLEQHPALVVVGRDQRFGQLFRLGHYPFDSPTNSSGISRSRSPSRSVSA